MADSTDSNDKNQPLHENDCDVSNTSATSEKTDEPSSPPTQSEETPSSIIGAVTLVVLVFLLDMVYIKFGMTYTATKPQNYSIQKSSNEHTIS